MVEVGEQGLDGPFSECGGFGLAVAVAVVVVVAVVGSETEVTEEGAVE